MTESAIFLGNFATYDATCLSLLAFAASDRGPHGQLPMAGVPARRDRRPRLAVGVKYAGLLFVPTIAVLPVLAGWPEQGRRVLWYPLGFGAAVAGLLLAALRLGGHYMTALRATTTNRAQGTTRSARSCANPPSGAACYSCWPSSAPSPTCGGPAPNRTRDRAGKRPLPAGGPRLLLTGTALLAPADQAHLHTDVSFLKHIGFGLFFAAPMAGFGLSRIMGDYFRRPQFGIAAWSMALVLGMVQSNQLYHEWPSSGPFVSAFARYLKPHARYLVEVPEVPMYYLMGRPDAQPDQFTSTYVITYFNSKGQALTGPAGSPPPSKTGTSRSSPTTTT